VLKDRAGLIDGKEFTNPTFESFLPHIERLNWGGMQRTVDLGRNSVASIPADIRDNRWTHRQIVLSEIEDLLVLHHPSTSGADKQAKLRLLRKYFDASWAEIDKLMPLERLRQGYDMLHVELEKSHSKYHVALAAAAIPADTADIDELPDHSAPPAAAEAKPKEVMPASPQPIPHPSIPIAAGAPTDEIDGIPPFLDRRQSALKDKLLAEIPELSTARDLLRWSLKTSPVLSELPPAAIDELSAAILVRQIQLNGAAAH
jgi:hypothetical protein